MTKKEFFKAVAENNITVDVIEKAKDLLTKEEKSNEKRTKAQTENRNANIELAMKFTDRMGDRTLAASEIFELVKDLVDNVSKVSAVCRVGVAEGILSVRDDYKVGGKGKTVKGYTPITKDRTEEDEPAGWEEGA